MARVARGFSLVEVLLVLALASLLSAALFFRIGHDGALRREAQLLAQWVETQYSWAEGTRRPLTFELYPPSKSWPQGALRAFSTSGGARWYRPRVGKVDSVDGRRSWTYQSRVHTLSPSARLMLSQGTKKVTLALSGRGSINITP